MMTLTREPEATVQFPRSGRPTPGVSSTAAGRDDVLAVRLGRDSGRVRRSLEQQATAAADRLGTVCRQALVAFHAWRQAEGGAVAPRGDWEAPVMTALIASIEALIPDGSPAFEQVMPALLDARVDLMDAWARRREASSTDALGARLERLMSGIRRGLLQLVRGLERSDEPAWNVVAVALLADPPDHTLATRVLQRRCGLPDPRRADVSTLWHAMADAHREWELVRWLGPDTPAT